MCLRGETAGCAWPPPLSWDASLCPCALANEADLPVAGADPPPDVITTTMTMRTTASAAMAAKRRRRTTAWLRRYGDRRRERVLRGGDVRFPVGIVRR